MAELYVEDIVSVVYRPGGSVVHLRRTGDMDCLLCVVDMVVFHVKHTFSIK